MPRDNTGIYTLPAKNPVATNTVIESDWANPTMSDIASTLTHSLSRDGQGTMLAALKLTDGTNAAPGLSFNSEAASGLFRKTAGVLGMSIGGVDIVDFSATGVAINKDLTIAGSLTGVMKLADGTAPLPSLAFTSDPNTGLYSAGADLIGVSVGGGLRASFTVNGIDLAGNKVLTGAGTTSGTWSVGALSSTGSLTLQGGSLTNAVIALNAVPDGGAAPGTSAATIQVFRSTNTTGVVSFNLYRGNNSTTVDHQFISTATGLAAAIARAGGRVTFGAQADDGVSDFQTTGLARINAAAYGQLGVREGGVYGGAGPNTSRDGIVVESNAATGLSFLTPNTLSAGIVFGDNNNNSAGYINYDHASDQMLFGINGTQRVTLDATFLQTTVPVLGADGSAAAPSFAFTTQPTWGMFRVPAIGIGLAVNGGEAVRFAVAGETFPVGNPAIMHADTTGALSIIGASSNVDGVARIDLYDTAHATLPRILALHGRGITFSDATAANEKGRFTVSTIASEFVLGRTTALYASTNRNAIEVDGVAGAIVGLHWGGARCGYLNAASATEFRVSSGLATVALTLCLNGTEVARVDTDSSFHYTPPATAASDPTEVGFRALPQVSTGGAAYTLKLADRGKCVVQSAAANVVTAAIFVAGDVVSIFNSSAGNVGIVATGITLNWGFGTPTTGNRTLAAKGMATLYFTAANVAKITGDGIS